jgi:hypothetical protein
MAHLQAMILIAILVAAMQAGLRTPTAAAANQVVPTTWLIDHYAESSLCTGVDLNVGCVPVELAGR